MTQRDNLYSKFSYILASISGINLLTMFWSVAIFMVFGVVMHGALLIVFAAIIETLLLSIWLGYSIALYFSLAKDPYRTLITYLLGLSFISVYLISMLGYRESFSATINSVISVIEIILIAAIIFAGALALKRREKEAKINKSPNIFITILALYAFPLFGAHIHDRYRRILRIEDKSISPGH